MMVLGIWTGSCNMLILKEALSTRCADCLNQLSALLISVDAVCKHTVL